MTATTAFDLDKLFEGSLRLLRTEAEYFSRLTDHNPELGRLNETHLVKLLREYLPPKIGIGTGFIVCGGSKPLQSPQCDIIFYDNLNNAPLYKSRVWSIYPIEMVYGVLEVKTTLNRAAFREAFEKCAMIRAMAKTSDGCDNKRYIRQVLAQPKSPAQYALRTSGLPPRFFIFGYDGWKSAAMLERNFRALSQEQESAHIHGVCNLHGNGSLYIRHEAFRQGDDRFFSITKNGFRFFLMNLPSMLDSMLPVDRIGIGFDQIYLKHYDLSVE